MLKRLTSLVLGLHVLANGAQVQADVITIETHSLNELLQESNPIDDVSKLSELRSALWNKYRTIVRADVKRQRELSTRSIPFKDKTMRYSFSKKGEKPAKGYPLFIALHGGGETAPSVNDSQWEAMKTYYLSSVGTGIYVAPRGVTDTWNLHFVDESYPLYDRLIENLVAFEDVDPERVYILGFSAGGDGVYQLAPKMADRWAAANMSAGHNNWVTFDNLYALPFLIQVGQNDSAYDRNKVAVQNSNVLNDFSKKRGGYIHEVYVHSNGSHNSWRDNDASRNLQNVLANPEGWLLGEAGVSKKINSNAIDWLNRYSRDSRPKQIFWDANVNAPERKLNNGAAYVNNSSSLSQPLRLFYWLDLGAQTGNLPQGVLRASYSKESNGVVLDLPAAVNHLRVLLDQDMLDLNQAISVSINGVNLGSRLVQANMRTLTRTLLERGDVRWAFPAEINLTLQNGVWSF